MSTISVSSSLNKRKKGLSLSLEKRSKNNNDTESTVSVLNSKSIRQSVESANTSGKKNKIKFAQSYQKYQSGSKFKRQNYLKVTDQDIKLGGAKRTDQFQRKVLPFTSKTPFSQYNSPMQFQPIPHSTISFTPLTAERKVLRESKMVNLTSNINYFQGVNLQNQKSFCFIDNSKSLIPQHIPALKLIQTQPLKKLETLEESKLEESSIRQSQLKKFDEDKKQNSIKQSMEKFTLQKLKKVQIDIDQLLAKASQTRAMLLR